MGLLCCAPQADARAVAGNPKEPLGFPGDSHSLAASILYADEAQENIGMKEQTRLRAAALIACWVVAAVAAAYVLTKHRAHGLEWLPYVALLACPLMHVFMHGQHDKHEPRQ